MEIINIGATNKSLGSSIIEENKTTNVNKKESVK